MLIKTLLMLALAAGAPEAPAADPMEEAASLYTEGTARFDAADYEGAIDKFTRALGIVVAAEGDDAVRLTLLYNIASAHEKQFALDRDVQHLRQALQLYERYRDFAQAKGSIDDIFDVEGKIAALEGKLRTHDQIERNKAAGTAAREGPPPPPPVTEDAADWQRPRRTGIGLVAAGGAAAVGGVVLAVVGSRLEPRAQDQVAELEGMNLPPDHPAWAQGDQFIEQERRKGSALMGVGATFAVVGAAGVGVGAYYLVKSKKMREGRVSTLPALSPGYAGVRIAGRF